MKIIPYQDSYRDDMIFMVLQAKDALGRKPGLNEDLLDVPGNYWQRGDGFWLAIDENDRVIGCVGYTSVNSREAFLRRLYVKAGRKHQGIGTLLLQTAEAAMREKGIMVIKVHLGSPPEQWRESYQFYPKYGYQQPEAGYMQKELK